MKIEVNNVYQKKSISKVKVALTILFVIILLAIIFGRLYYERTQTNPVIAFVEFIGTSVASKKEDTTVIESENVTIENAIKVEEGATNNDNNFQQVNNTYIPNFTEQSLNNINKIYNLSEDKQKIVYLTFDDGPSRDVTPLVLDVLKEENIKATFFVLGLNVDSNPDILKRVYNEGHYVANHRLFT